MAGPASSIGCAAAERAQNVSVRFGGIVALDGVTFDVFPGQIAGLIGPNGAGKTTLFNCLSRLYTPNGGDMLFEGKSILDRPRHAIPHIGIGRTFQNVALFDRMSGARQRQGRLPQPQLAPASSTTPAPAQGRDTEEQRIAERADELIDFMDLVPFTPRAGRRPAVPDPQARRAGARARLAAPSCCCSTSRRPA